MSESFVSPPENGRSESSCYHCGLPIPEAADFPVVVGERRRHMCCLGCQAVAQAIVDGGLDDYYRTRDALPGSPRDAAQVLEDLKLYDHAAVQKSFVRALDEHEREASLILEGITCAACIWLNEQHLAKLPGVTGVSINYATRRARVRWDERRLQLSDVLGAIRAIGYTAHPYDPGRHEQLAQKERRDALWRLFVSGFSAMQVMMYAVPVYLAGDGEMTPDIEQLMRWVSLILTLPVLLYSSGPFMRSAWRDLKMRRAGMDVPVALGIVVGFGASAWATLTASGEVYFDSVSMFVFLLLSGRFLEMQARQRAVAANESLARQLPTVASRLSDYPASMAVETVAAAELLPGDRVLVRPGEVVPADGVVVSGESAVDESLLTGESMPVHRRPGDVLTGGATNAEGALVMRVERAGEASRLSAILRLLERAAHERPRLVETADRVAGRFVLAILLVSAMVAVAWWFINPAKALWIAVAVLVVTCPCALSLATPVAMTVAHGVLARRGFLVTRGSAVETLARVTHVVFDKTGTLTEGRLRLLEVQTNVGVSEAQALAVAAALEGPSEHPLARAFREAAAAREINAAPAMIENFCNRPGRGVEAVVDGVLLRIGRSDYVRQPAWTGDLPVSVEAMTEVVLGSDAGWFAIFRFADAIRPEAEAVVKALQTAGIEVSILSGDAPSSVSAVAATLGVARYQAACLPDDKLAAVKTLQAAGQIVAVFGDGINDAPVLAQAQVSVAMGGGADLAKVNADCVLLGDSLAPAVFGFRTARKTLRIVRENLAWSILYNILAIPLAAAGWVTPWLAGIGMSGSSLLVVLNALRLKWGAEKT